MAAGGFLYVLGYEAGVGSLYMAFLLLCVFASYQLVRRRKMTSAVTTALLGMVALPAALSASAIAALYLLHVHNIVFLFDVAFVAWLGGWLGAGAARLNNLKQRL